MRPKRGKQNLQPLRHPEGHDILTPKDRNRKTQGDKKNRNQPKRGKAFQTILVLFIKYSYNRECREVKAQEQTDVGPSTTLNGGQIDRLWTKSSSDTGTSTDVDLTKGMQKAPLIGKNKTTPMASEKQDQERSQETDNNRYTNDSLIKCPEYGASFLRAGNLDKHKESKVCIKRQKSKRALAVGQNILRYDKMLNSSLQRAERYKHQTTNKSDAAVNLQKQNQSQWNKIIHGTALRSHQGKKKSVRFSRLQIAVMIDCYDKGKDLSKRYTPAMCQREMRSHPELGPENTLRKSSTVILEQAPQITNQTKQPKQYILEQTIQCKYSRIEIHIIMVALEPVDIWRQDSQSREQFCLC